MNISMLLYSTIGTKEDMESHVLVMGEPEVEPDPEPEPAEEVVSSFSMVYSFVLVSTYNFCKIYVNTGSMQKPAQEHGLPPVKKRKTESGKIRF